MNFWVISETLLREIFKLIWFHRILVVFSRWHHASIMNGFKSQYLILEDHLEIQLGKFWMEDLRNFDADARILWKEWMHTDWYYFHSRNCDNFIYHDSILCGCETKPEIKFFCEWSTIWSVRRDLGDEILLASIHMQSPEKSFEPLLYKKYDTMKLEYHFERWKNWLNFISQ